MLDLLKRFAALSLVSGLMLSLLPEGSMRRTASMAVGLLILICWADGICALLEDFDFLPDGYVPSSVLSATEIALDSSWEAAAHALQERTEDSP